MCVRANTIPVVPTVTDVRRSSKTDPGKEHSWTTPTSAAVSICFYFT